MIEVKDVCKKLDHNKVLDHINITLEDGKIYGFIGHNGSGKSMLFRILCGLICPSSGIVLMDGIDIHQKGIFHTSIGALIERPRFLENVSGYQNLKLLADINHKIDNKEIMEVLKAVGLYQEKDKKFRKYSLGMKQKLGIAQAIMENPRILILDEPFNGLDRRSTDLIRNIIRNFKTPDRIIVISSHHIEDIRYLCDVVYQLDEGKIVSVKKMDGIL